MNQYQDNESVKTLLLMLSYKRPAWSDTEREFIDEFIMPHKPLLDTFGNLWVTVGDNPHILWSSHTDTVHSSEGRQGVEVLGCIATAVTGEKRELSNCLGADCATGVWLMLEMIKAKVSGLYIFHRDEECGGRGSTWIAPNVPEMLSGIKFAIALDRKGYDSVITHQGSRTASDEFARSMAAILGGKFAPDDTGVFTDTAMYTSLIPECTNLSVGYFNQHGPREIQDIDFAVALRDKLITADFSSLVEHRKVTDTDDYDRWWLDRYDPKATSYESFLDRKYDKKGNLRRDYDEDDRGHANDDPPWQAYGYGDKHYNKFVRFIRDNPDVAADYLEMLGVGLSDLQEHADMRS